MIKKLVRRSPLAVAACAVSVLLFHLFPVLDLLARPDALEEGVERLARKAAALPHERQMTLLWANHSGLSEQRAERLRAVFAAQWEAAQGRFAQSETAPPLRVAIEQTPSQIVFTAMVPGEGSIGVVIEEVARAAAGVEAGTPNGVRLQKELLWRQETKILSAAAVAGGAAGEKKLLVLTEEAILIYRGAGENWNLEFTKALPGPRQAQRSARGQLLVAEDSNGRVGILLPGKRCEANLADESAIACASLATEWPSGRAMALPGCVAEPLWLKSDGLDWTSQDRLLLRNAGKDAAAVAELGVGGPVVSISAAENAGSATVVVRDLRSGNYEVYRVALACGD